LAAWCAAVVVFVAAALASFFSYLNFSHPEYSSSSLPVAGSTLPKRHAPYRPGDRQKAGVPASLPLGARGARRLSAAERCFDGRVYYYVARPDGSMEPVALTIRGRPVWCRDGWVRVE
jgi:hypothetical protein